MVRLEVHLLFVPFCFEYQLLGPWTYDSPASLRQKPARGERCEEDKGADGARAAAALTILDDIIGVNGKEEHEQRCVLPLTANTLNKAVASPAYCGAPSY